MLTFDRNALLIDMVTLSKRGRLALATASATRAFPFYEAFCRKTAWGDPAALRTALTYLWARIEGQRPHEGTKVHRATVDSLAAMEPRDGFGRDYTLSHYIALSIRECLVAEASGRPENAIKALEWIFEVTYGYARSVMLAGKGPTQLTLEMDKAICAHSAVQAELRRQKRDFDDLLSAGRSQFDPTIEQLRERSEKELALPANAKFTEPRKSGERKGNARLHRKRVRLGRKGVR